MEVSLDKFTWYPLTRTYLTDASTLRLKPGVWPEKISVVNKKDKREADFFFDSLGYVNGELVAAKYNNASTICLKVYND